MSLPIITEFMSEIHRIMESLTKAEGTIRDLEKRNKKLQKVINKQIRDHNTNVYVHNAGIRRMDKVIQLLQLRISFLEAENRELKRGEMVNG